MSYTEEFLISKGKQRPLYEVGGVCNCVTCSQGGCCNPTMSCAPNIPVSGSSYAKIQRSMDIQSAFDYKKTERTALDAELARQTLLRLKFEDETRRQASVKSSIEEEAARAADKAVKEHLYESTQQEIDLKNKLVELRRAWAATAKCGSNPRTCGVGAWRAYVNYNKCKAEGGNCDSHYPVLQEIRVIESKLEDIRENKREEFRLQFITTATEREGAVRLQERNAALETIRLVEEAQERERLRMIQEEAEQRELEATEYAASMAAIEAEQQEALRLAEINRQIGLNAVTSEGEKTFKVEVPQPVMASMSIPTPMLLVGGAAVFLLLARRK